VNRPTPAPASLGWTEAFTPFGPFHAIVVLLAIVLVAGSCVLGRRWRGGPFEPRLRSGWIAFTLLWQVGSVIWWVAPMDFNEDVLPLHVCDIAAWVAPLALWTQARWLRAWLYFWAIGLSTQAFVTPVLRDGLAYPHFWLFWVGHLQIVGSAIYDVAVLGYRPKIRDLAVVITISVVYGVFVMALNLTFGWNYAYIGKGAPDAPTLIDHLGPWPFRVLPLVSLAFGAMALAWLPWALADRAKANRATEDGGSN
jgi:hypothetical integral membrane protein (TIGR02206 family)